MLTYELAKELRSAGYPIKDSRCEDCFKNDYSYCSVCRDQVESVPTLSELIEACGDDFILLEKRNSGWECVPCDKFGSTPEEAVANLWLELNKK